MKAIILAAVCDILQGCSAEPVGPECPALLSGWAQPKDGRSAFRFLNVISLDGRVVLWNRMPVQPETLRKYIAASKRMNPEPLTVLDPTNATDCSVAEHLRDDIDRVLDCGGAGRGLCGQGPITNWLTAPDLSVPGWVE